MAPAPMDLDLGGNSCIVPRPRVKKPDVDVRGIPAALAFPMDADRRAKEAKYGKGELLPGTQRGRFEQHRASEAERFAAIVAAADAKQADRHAKAEVKRALKEAECARLERELREAGGGEGGDGGEAADQAEAATAAKVAKAPTPEEQAVRQPELAPPGVVQNI